MFDEILRELRRLEGGNEIPIEIQPDEDGYFDRICPNNECKAYFKVLFLDWKDKVRDEVVYCPICRFEAESGEWDTPKQLEYFSQSAVRYTQQKIEKAIKKDVGRFNRSQSKGGFVRMSLSYCSSSLPVRLPVEAYEIMRQRSICEKCGCRYSSVGAAFFCPACGHNCAVSTFNTSVDTVRQTIAFLPKIRQVMTETYNSDTAEDTIRQLCENGLVKLVASFQRFAEAKFDGLPDRSQLKPRKNVFQNLSDSSGLWCSAIGVGYEEMLTTSELAKLECFFQQRHLLSHKEGMVDQAYIDKSGDNRYSVSQRLVVSATSVQDLSELVSKLASELSKRL